MSFQIISVNVGTPVVLDSEVVKLIFAMGVSTSTRVTSLTVLLRMTSESIQEASVEELG